MLGRIVGLFFAICLCHNLSAHDPTQIAYVLEGNQLTIHLTPKGALDLITVLNPDLEKHNVVQLSDYMDDFSGYFNEHIEIKLSNEDKWLHYENSDLTKHDAYIQFSIMDASPSDDLSIIHVDAFEDVYRNVDNQIFQASRNSVFAEQRPDHLKLLFAFCLLLISSLIYTLPAKSV